MEFDWDEAKSERNRLEPGFGFDFAALIFEGQTIEWPDDRVDYGEHRVRAIGGVEAEILHVVYTDRGDARRIVSARKASRRERTQWRASR